MRLPVWLRLRTGIFSSGPFVPLRKLLRKPPLWLLRLFLAGLLGLAVAWPGLLVEHLPVTTLWAFLQDIPLRVWAGAGVTLAVLVVTRKVGKPRQPVGEPVLREPRPAAWWIVPAALLVGGTVAVVAWWLLSGLPDKLDPYHAVTARRGAVQTALTAGGGIGAAIMVMLAFRRQRHQEQTALITNLHADRSADLAEQVAEHNRHDATERRVTELYTNAADQLDSDKAPVRLAGLYALERLAQGNPDHRQTIVNLICAYLRMPYTPPPDTAQQDTVHVVPRVAIAGASTPANGHDPHEERQVRLTAQSILAKHLRNDHTPQQREQGETADPRFWEGMHIDLTGATLINFNFNSCHTTDARFFMASFTGDTQFVGASFTRVAGFVGASFTGGAWFIGASFTGVIGFDWATFAGGASFGRATFAGDVGFDGATFAKGVEFDGATFAKGVEFDGAVVMEPADSHVWPKGWRVVVQADGTGRLKRETEPEPDSEDEEEDLPASEEADLEDEKPAPSIAEPDDPAEPAEPDDDLP